MNPKVVVFFKKKPLTLNRSVTSGWISVGPRAWAAASSWRSRSGWGSTSCPPRRRPWRRGRAWPWPRHARSTTCTGGRGRGNKLNPPTGCPHGFPMLRLPEQQHCLIWWEIEIGVVVDLQEMLMLPKFWHLLPSWRCRWFGGEIFYLCCCTGNATLETHADAGYPLFPAKHVIEFVKFVLVCTDVSKSSEMSKTRCVDTCV